jgi:beta-glucanase (GH16 family)
MTIQRSAILLACFIISVCAGSRPVWSTDGLAPSAWTLTWSDEFNGPSGSAPDSTKWTFDTGGNGWGNRELETYTSRPKNVYQDHGNLVISAFREKFTGEDGIERNYTSGRLKSEGLFAQKYGRFEARIKIPNGQGMWPAFWLLGDNVRDVGWPNCGEVDIMENIGSEPRKNHGSMHQPGAFGNGSATGIYTLSHGSRLGDAFHIYALEWDPKSIRFYVDDNLYETQTPASLPAGATWVFDHPFFIILNVAVGGSWPGRPDASTVFPQNMLVDYVRVYARQ